MHPISSDRRGPATPGAPRWAALASLFGVSAAGAHAGHGETAFVHAHAGDLLLALAVVAVVGVALGVRAIRRRR